MQRRHACASVRGSPHQWLVRRLLTCAAVATLLSVSASRRAINSPAHAQGEIPLPPPTGGEPSPHEGITLIKEVVTTTAASLRMNAGLRRQLLIPLDGALASLRQADPRAAIRHVDVFKNKLQALIRARNFPIERGQMLIGSAEQSQQDIAALLSQEHFARAMCQPGSFDGAARLLVGAGGDFATIGEALAFAQDGHFPAVALLLSAGEFRREDDILPITRHTRIQGAVSEFERSALVGSSILNTGPYLLSIERVELRASGWPGAIVVDGPCAETILEGVEISRARGFGVQQHGGSLTMHSVDIHGTEVIADDPATGVGLHLSGGVVACLAGVGFHDNAGSAFVAAGADTRVHATVMTAFRNSVHPLVAEEVLRTGEFVVTDGIAAIEVRDDALFLGECLQVSDNDLVGLLAHAGGLVHVRNSRIARTYSVEGEGGINAVVHQGELQLTHCDLEFADLAGLVINDARAKLTDSFVSHNPIGVSVRTAGFDLACIQDNVTFERNARNLDSDEIPVPGPIPDVSDGLPASHGSSCASVDFFAPWCE